MYTHAPRLFCGRAADTNLEKASFISASSHDNLSCLLEMSASVLDCVKGPC